MLCAHLPLSSSERVIRIWPIDGPAATRVMVNAPGCIALVLNRTKKAPCAVPRATIDVSDGSHMTLFIRN